MSEAQYDEEGKMIGGYWAVEEGPSAASKAGISVRAGFLGLHSYAANRLVPCIISAQMSWAAATAPLLSRVGAGVKRQLSTCRRRN